MGCPWWSKENTACTCPSTRSTEAKHNRGSRGKGLRGSKGAASWKPSFPVRVSMEPQAAALSCKTGSESSLPGWCSQRQGVNSPLTCCCSEKGKCSEQLPPRMGQQPARRSASRERVRCKRKQFPSGISVPNRYSPPSPRIRTL